jgi:hypothetical protein
MPELEETGVQSAGDCFAVTFGTARNDIQVTVKGR